MPKGILIVHTNPVNDDVTDAFNRWYNDVHLPEALQAVPGFKAATRYEVAEAEANRGAPRPAHRYIAVVEVESDDFEVLARDLNRAFLKFDLDSTLDAAGIEAHFYQAVSERLEP
jgi:hypothetical protein